MSEDVTAWLRAIGLGEYAQTFEQNEVDWSLLPKLSNEFLKDLGVEKVGHRMRLLEAVEALEEKRVSNDTSPPAAVEPEREAGRRQLTVMFCDLVGSTELSTQLDPEDLRDLMGAFQSACREAIALYDGFVARYMGDGILVYFGYPYAHDNDPERAIRAGVAIARAISSLKCDAANVEAVPLAVRIGVATGPVVVGDIIGEGAAEEAAVVGATPNLAARLQGAAHPNQVAICQVTKQLAGECFVFEAPEVLSLKGLAEPTTVWRVATAPSLDAPSEPHYAQAMGPLIGRKEELGLLIRAWEASKAGHGQAILLQGEAGVGKSRLLNALRETLTTQPVTTLWLRCSPYHATSPLYPVIEHLQRVMEWTAEDDDATRLHKLESALAAQSTPLAEVVPLLAELLALPLDQSQYPLPEMTPSRKREATLDAVAAWMLELAERASLLHVFEDLHWADPSTLELIGLLLEQLPTVSMLGVFSYRPDFRPPWPTRSHVIPMTLPRLERTEVEAIAQHLAGGKHLPSVVLSYVTSKADGVPLYVEELTKTILESDIVREEAGRYVLLGSLSDLHIPDTLQGSLMARLDRAPELRELAQTASVIGRQFTYNALLHLSEDDEASLAQTLQRLVAAEIFYQRGRGEAAVYRFKHALIQEAAYNSLLRRDRQRLHGRLAALLESQLATEAADHPEIIAHHYSRSGTDAGLAVKYWSLAANHALSRGAHSEAVSQVSAALQDLLKLAPSVERDRIELDLQTKLGPAISVTAGYTDTRIRHCYARAQSLCEALGEERQLVFVLRWQHTDQLVRGDVTAAGTTAIRLEQAAERQADVGLRVGGCLARALADLFSGHFGTAVQHAERGMTLFDPSAPRIEGWPGGQPGEQCWLMAAWCRWLLGQPDQALAYVQTALRTSEGREQRFTHVLVLSLGSLVHIWRGEASLAEQWLRQSEQICAEDSMSFWHLFNQCLLGWAAAGEGSSRAELDRFEQALARYEAQDTRLLVPVLLGLLAERCGAAGEIERGLEAVHRGLRLIAESSDTWMEAELLRVKGELLGLRSPSTAEDAEATLGRAIDLARAQGARSIELRALVSLVGLISARGGEAIEARAMLARCYQTFTEGFETADLRRAKNLIDDEDEAERMAG